jgi:hypothetical protein
MSELLPAITDRDIIFVSHANPEDNAFATWLTLRLTREGYRVWCDVVKLRGGDDFWKDVETTIRQHTRRFIFVTSRASNQKPGTLQELAVASGVARDLNEPRFIVPVKIDDLPFSDHNIQINRLNALSFTKGWAEGLTHLLHTFEEDAIPRPEVAGASCIASWWNTNRANREILQNKPETLWTNWFPLQHMPSRMWVWDIPEDATLPQTFAFPTYRHGDKLFSFADAIALLGRRGSPTGGRGQWFAFNSRKEPPRRTHVQLSQVKTAAKQILIQAWNTMAESRGLPLYEMSSRRRTLWFPLSAGTGDMVPFDGVDGKVARRALHGYKTMKQATGERWKRHWHFGLEALPVLYPQPVLALKSHVVFTRDGETPLGDAKAQHRARRSQCKEWWNDKWRDMTLAAVTWLAGQEHCIELTVKPDDNPVLDLRPIKYRSHVGYDDSKVRITALEQETGDDEFEDEQDDEA